jgi:hydrogenase maturation protease
MRWLVIGVGNELRRDDGLGPWLAERIAEWGIPGVAIRTVQQLTPELAAASVQPDRVLFIDADRVHTEPTLTRVPAKLGNSRLGHALGAEEVMAFAETLSDRVPPAWLALVPGSDFEFGEGHSGSAAKAAEAALIRIGELLRGTDPCTKSD